MQEQRRRELLREQREGSPQAIMSETLSETMSAYELAGLAGLLGASSDSSATHSRTQRNAYATRRGSPSTRMETRRPEARRALKFKLEQQRSQGQRVCSALRTLSNDRVRG